jgi:hypothetical protein
MVGRISRYYLTKHVSAFGYQNCSQGQALEDTACANGQLSTRGHSIYQIKSLNTTGFHHNHHVNTRNAMCFGSATGTSAKC